MYHSVDLRLWLVWLGALSEHMKWVVIRVRCWNLHRCQLTVQNWSVSNATAVSGKFRVKHHVSSVSDIRLIANVRMIKD
jgi:hypothetical protein